MSGMSIFAKVDPWRASGRRSHSSSANVYSESGCLNEGEILEFFAGRLQGPVREAIEHHLDACPSCLDLVADVAAGIAGAASDTGASLSPLDADLRMEVANLESDEPAILPWGALIGGRYEIRKIIGVGGMGIVYSCFDRSLEREVALKVLRYRPSTQKEVVCAEERLLREAQLLAGLSHPNIVVVFDVGSDDGRVFIAMELVRGRTLEAWLEASPPSSQERILEVFVAVGRGLAAAHAAGVIHRDLKPANVLVGDDGRIRVTDFGLALSREGAFEATRSGYNRRQSLPQTNECRGATSGRSWVGTPRYMSPEQLSGAAASTASDQFAFTLALAEALLGSDPFPATTLEERQARIAAGPVLSSGRSGGLSRTLRGLLRRGLSVHASERYPSMEVLCDELDRIRKELPWRLWSALGLSLVTLVALVGLRVMSPATTCENGEQIVSEVWSPEVRDRIETAVKGAHDTMAVETWRGVEPLFDSFATDWTRAYSEACAEVSDDHSAQRKQALTEMECLEQTIDYLNARVTQAGQGDAEMLRAVLVEGRSTLPSILRHCEETESGLFAPFPEHPALQGRVFVLRLGLHDVLQLQLASDMEGAERLIEALATEAEPLAYTPLLTEVLRRRGLVEHQRGDLERASRTFERALALAEESAYDRIIPDLWVALAHVNISRGHLDDAELALKHADAYGQRPSLATQTRRRRLSMRAHLLRALGHHHAALKVDREMLELALNDLDTARILVAESISRSALGEWQQALQLQRQALALREKVLDKGHTRIAGAHNLLGETLMALGEMQEAEKHLLQALRIRERLGEDGDLDRARVLLNTGRLALAQGDPAQALCVLVEALEIRETRLGGEHPEVAEALMGVAEIYRVQGEAAAAVPLLRRAHRIRAGRYGPDHPQTSLALIAYAEASLSIDEGAAELDGAALLDLTALARALEVLENAEIRPQERVHARAVVERARTVATSGR